MKEKPDEPPRVSQHRSGHSLPDRARQLLPELDSHCDYENENFHDSCRQIYDLMDSVDRHDEVEVELIQETFLCDEGGEG